VPAEDRSHEFGEFSLERRGEDEGRTVVFLLMPPYDEHLDEIAERYPGGESVTMAEEDRVIFVAYVLPATATAPCVEGEWASFGRCV
jgi:hypothetical protein